MSLHREARPLRLLNIRLHSDGRSLLSVSTDRLLAMNAILDLAQIWQQNAGNLLLQHSLQFAMLDINVGRGASFELATTLKKAGTPFIFASGYGDELALERRSGEEVVIQKPYERDHLARAIDQVVWLVVKLVGARASKTGFLRTQRP